MAESCFLAKISHFLELTSREKDALISLEESPRHYEAGTAVHEEGESSADALYVVREGRLHASTMLADGARAILRIFYPGDVLGTSNIAFPKAAATTITSVPSTLCRFPRSRLNDIFEQHPRLSALFYAISALENVTLEDRLKSIGRTEGKARIGALILEILNRLRTTHPEIDDTVELNLTQADIGDAVGLTNVHVHRCLKELAVDGLIQRTGSRVTVLQEERLAEMSHFTNRWGSIDTSWFPGPR